MVSTMGYVRHWAAAMVIELGANEGMGVRDGALAASQKVQKERQQTAAMALEMGAVCRWAIALVIELGVRDGMGIQDETLVAL